MIHTSASSLWRNEKCPPSAVLPAAARVYQDAEEGTRDHAKLEQLAPAGSMAEVAFAYDPETGVGRELGKGLQRNYSHAKPNEIPGTSDLVTVEPDLVRIRDYKTGHGYMVAPPRKNLQLLHNGLSAASAYGKERVVLEVEKTLTGEPPEKVELDAFDLTLARFRIRSVWSEIRKAEEKHTRGEQLRVVEGDHCWRCECYSRCPAKVELAIALATGQLPRLLPTMELTVESVSTGWTALKLIKKLAGEVERIYRGFAAEHDIPIGENKWLGLREGEREQLDGAVVFQVLKQMHGEDVARAAVEMETSKSALDKALKAIAQPRGRAALVRAVLAEVEKAGGIDRKPQKRVEEFTEERK